MDISTNLQLLSEAAQTDMKINTANRAKYDTVYEAYKNIPTMDELSVTEASDVIVTETRNHSYYVEMVNLAPFMLDSGIKSISKALDMVAEANGLEPGMVGLVVESQSAVDAKLESAKNRARSTGNYNIVENVVNKINKNNLIINRLIREGYDVVKKSDSSKVCPKCGKATDKCVCKENDECGDGNCAPDSKAAIAEKCKK